MKVNLKISITEIIIRGIALLVLNFLYIFNILNLNYIPSLIGMFGSSNIIRGYQTFSDDNKSAIFIILVGVFSTFLCVNKYIINSIV
jgi:hypothetical protein